MEWGRRTKKGEKQGKGQLETWTKKKTKKTTTTTTTKTIYYTDYITLNLKITKGQITAYALNSGRKKLNEPKGLNSGETLS